MIANIPRGVRNNNPGNIEYDQRVQWDGLAGIELAPLDGSRPRFARFDTAEHGIRAIVKVLRSYTARGINTVPKIIGTYAPGAAAGDNNPVAAYTKFVEGAAHVTDEYVIGDLVKEPFELSAGLARAIIKFECSGFEYPSDVLSKGVAMGLGMTVEA